MVAFRLFFSVLAENSPGASDQIPSQAAAAARQKAKLYPVRLQAGDQGLLIASLSTFRKDLHGVLVSSDPSSQSADDFTQQLVDSLKVKMTHDGFERLNAYIRSQKPFMKRIALPDMGSQK